MSSSPQPGPVWFSTYCPSTCSGMRASKSTKAKQGLGTPPGSSRQASVSLAPLTPRCGSVTQPCRPSNRGSLHLGFLVAILHMLLPSCKPHAPSRTCSFKASARCPTFSPHGCCFCFVLPRAAVTFCGPCHPWLRSPLRKPMTRLSPPALRIWGRPAPGPRAPPCPAPFPARWPQPAVCGRPRSGRVLGLVGRHSSRAAPPAPALRRRRCCQAWSRRARRPHPPRRASVTGSACCGRV